MRPIELAVLYLIVGTAVTVAGWRARRSGAWMSLLLWPLFLPGMLATAAEAPPPARHDGIDRLRAALAAWEGAPQGAECNAALDAAARGLDALSDRVAQLDGVLALPAHDLGALQAERDGHPDTAAILDARIANVHRLQTLRAETFQRLERGLASLDDLATRVHLARFTGDDADAVAGLLARLAAAVDSASEVASLASR